ncbi:MAG: hypothetical protein R8J84_00915 [Mariprofundales bacterium]
MRPIFETDHPQLCQRTAFAIITIDGERVDDYLQGQISQEMARLTPQALLYGALLTPQGKAVCDLWIAADGAARRLIVPSCAVETALARLRQFSIGFTLSMTIDPQWQLWSLQGAGSGALAQPLPLAFTMAEAAADGAWILAPAQPAIDAPVVDETVIEAGRICYGSPYFGIDWQEHPLNANLMERGGISFDKGCFVGQEVASRMRWRNGIRKRLFHLQLKQMPADLPMDICTSVAVGRLTSAAMDKAGNCFGIGQIAIDSAESPLTLGDGTPITILEPANHGGSPC